VKVLQPLAEPVRRVALTLDPVEGATPAELDEILRGIARPLILDGVSVLPRPQVGAPELIGHVGTYRPGLRLTAVWLLLGANGATLGQCRTDFGVSAGFDGVDWGDVVQGTGDGLAEFLAAKP
jgi:hypothetical protein